MQRAGRLTNRTGGDLRAGARGDASSRPRRSRRDLQLGRLWPVCVDIYPRSRECPQVRSTSRGGGGARQLGDRQEPQAPFGGMNASSSHSREQGKAAAEFFTDLKTVYIDQIGRASCRERV